jgi:hypothetical protein
MNKRKKGQSHRRPVVRLGEAVDLEITEISGEPVFECDFATETGSKVKLTLNVIKYSTEERESDGESRVVYRLEAPRPKHDTTLEFPTLPKRPRGEIFLNLAEGAMVGGGIFLSGDQEFFWDSPHPRLPSDVGDDIKEQYLSLLLRLVDELNQSFGGAVEYLQQRGRTRQETPGPGSVEAIESETAAALTNALAAIRTANLLDDPVDFLVGHAFGYLLHSSLVARNEARRKYAKALRARRGSGNQAEERRQWIKHQLFDLIEKKSTAGRSRREIKSLVRQKYAKEFKKSDNTFRGDWKAIEADVLLANAP